MSHAWLALLIAIVVTQLLRFVPVALPLMKKLEKTAVYDWLQYSVYAILGCLVYSVAFPAEPLHLGISTNMVVWQLIILGLAILLAARTRKTLKPLLIALIVFVAGIVLFSSS